MNIGVDARPLVEKKVGFGFFLENMLIEILTHDSENMYYLFSDREVFFDYRKYNNVEVVNYRDTFFCPKSFYYYLKLANYIKKEGIKLDVFWGTEHLMPRGFSKDIKKVLTLHDFTHIKFPKSTTKYNLLISKLFFGPSINNSDEIICISKNSKKELKEYYPKQTKDKNIHVIYEGGYRDGEVGKLTYSLDEVSKTILELVDEKYVLFVGTIEPRKNISLLIKAAPLLKGKVKVVVCGKIGWEKEQIINQLKQTENLIYLNYISQSEKAFLMKHAFCQVQPSLYEGFGLPVVESMQSDTVVIVANNSSLDELIEMQELKFDTYQVRDLCNKVVMLLENADLYNKARQYCSKRGNDFSWNTAAIEYISVFKKKNLE